MAEPDVLNAPIIIGDANGLRCALQWRDDYGSAGPVGRTWGELQLWVGNTLIWGDAVGDRVQPQGLRWGWIDLLEFLAIAWPYLEEEETLPIEFDSAFDAPRHLGELRGRARLRWRRLPEDRTENEAEQLQDFLQVHDLGEALHGAFPPSLLLLRQGRQMRIATAAREWTLSFSDCMGVLMALADCVAERVGGLGDERSQLALKRWQGRDGLDVVQRLAVATALPAGQLERIWPLPLDAGTSGLYELKAAARMIGNALSDRVLAKVLARVNDVPAGKASGLHEPRALAAEIMNECTADAPYQQGYRLAEWLREDGDSEAGRVDPAALLKQWGVDLQEIALDNPGLDAIAVWGEGRRPTVIVNAHGMRSKLPRGRRVTYAHELCHLLVDTDGALPAAEVLGGRVPPDVEKRANAFAAEFLLPRFQARLAADEALRHVHTADARKQAIEQVLNTLADRYDVSHETAAWQLKNSGALSHADEDTLQPYLKSLWAPS